MTEETIDAGESAPQGESVDEVVVIEDAVVIAVTDDGDDSAPVDPGQLDAVAESGRAELRTTIAELQQELSGMAKTGVPGVDDALARLADLDPDDLSASADVLTEVLARLESVMNETPQE